MRLGTGYRPVHLRRREAASFFCAWLSHIMQSVFLFPVLFLLWRLAPPLVAVAAQEGYCKLPAWPRLFRRCKHPALSPSPVGTSKNSVPYPDLGLQVLQGLANRASAGLRMLARGYDRREAPPWGRVRYPLPHLECLISAQIRDYYLPLCRYARGRPLCTTYSGKVDSDMGLVTCQLSVGRRR